VIADRRDWRLLPLSPPPGAAVLAEILDGGQAFRWQRLAPAEPGAIQEWQGGWSDYSFRVRPHPSGIEWSAQDQGDDAKPRAALSRYFDAENDADALADALPWRSDAHLARCLTAFPGLRILRQPFGETLLAFLCSATKQIPQIKQMMGELAVRHGAWAAAESGPRIFRRLPTWSELAEPSESDLRACRLGFRARHIRQTAQFLATHPGWLEETEALPYPEARARLCSLSGVGEKIADCVLLFGAGRLEAFPVDTWILRAMASRYGLHGWKPGHLAHFGRIHFGPRAGLAQQYLFAWERSHGRVSA
jgi:N-glycosylase/DNA lyase